MKSDPISPERVASIDLGTNTILLLIAKIEGGKIYPLFEIETVVRLGEGVQKDGTLLKEAMERKSLLSERAHFVRPKTRKIS